MESLHEPSLRALERLDAVFDPRRTPDAFVPFLATWVDLERLFDPRFSDPSRSRAPIDTGLGRLRELTAAAADLSKWRGTTRGLLRFLETATGESGFEIVEEVSDSEGRQKPFHVVVRAPSSVAPYRRLIERIIDQEKPAYVTYELVIGSDEAGRHRPAEDFGVSSAPVFVEKPRRTARTRARTKPALGKAKKRSTRERGRGGKASRKRPGRPRREKWNRSIDPASAGAIEQRRI
jgi:phage tail-like protein